MSWIFRYEGFDPEQERLREALCTLGNGYFATRGAAAEARADEVHYPGTYLAGGYNRLDTEIAGRLIENEDLVNLPNWLELGLRIGDAEWFQLKAVEILEYGQALDIEHGVLSRTIRFRDAADRVSRIEERRLVHMAHKHLAALQIELTAENWSGTVRVRSAIDGRVINCGVARYRELNSRHLVPECSEQPEADTMLLRTCTSQSRIAIVMAARTRLYLGDERAGGDATTLLEDDYAAQEHEIALDEGATLRVEKIVSLYTSRDRAISEPGLAARGAVARAGRYDALAASHSLRWEQLWRRFDIQVRDGNGARTQLILRLHTFHLLQTASPHAMDQDAGVPARGWHGEAYRGHVFWDELFIFPLLNLRLPEITRGLLMYRYRRLGAARANAREAGLRGAMYPWQSGSSGREESQLVHLNPVSGRWVPDSTWLQRHVNCAIAYNVWQYYQVTHDIEFLADFGAEMFLEIARFWGSFAQWNESLGRYEIKGVVGPDEFHTAYPGSDHPGLDNHSYTNLTVVWLLRAAREVMDTLPAARLRELRETLELDDAELQRWDHISRRMRVVFHDRDIISQFEGYDALEELDWKAYRKKYGDIARLDRILEAEGDTPNRYKAAKQADVLMLFYLFSAEELEELFGRLGYPFDHDTIPRNIEFYARRTTHGSTLSALVDSWVIARSDREGSWKVFRRALESDVADVQGGTTPEGIHLGAMAGTVDLLQRCYTGIVTRGDALWLNPCLPAELNRLEMTIRYRGHTLELRLTHDAIAVSVGDTNHLPVRLGIIDEVFELQAGERREFTVPRHHYADAATGGSS